MTLTARSEVGRLQEPPHMYVYLQISLPQTKYGAHACTVARERVHQANCSKALRTHRSHLAFPGARPNVSSGQISPPSSAPQTRTTP